MIEGKDRLARMGREVEDALRGAWFREVGIEPQIHVSQVPHGIVIEAEGFNTEGFVVSISETKGHLQQ